MDKIAFISDIHGNAIALNAVLEDIRSQNCNRVFVLGDVINGMDPSNCISILKRVKNLRCIKGNAEYYVLTPDLDVFPHDNKELYPDLIATIQWWQQHMSQADLDVIRGWPEFLQINGWYIVHDSPLDRVVVKQIDLGGIHEKYREILFHGVGIHQNISGDELHRILSFMDENRISSLFVGHTHEPFIKHVDGKVICNLGSVGFTLDGDPRSSWVLYEQEGTRQSLSIRRVAYNIDQAIQRLAETGFLNFAGEHRQNAYIKMLQTGIHWRAHI